MTEIYALTIIGEKVFIFDLADELGFEAEMDALAVTLFEEPDGSYQVQALYDRPDAPEKMKAALDLSKAASVNIAALPNEDWVAVSQAGLPPIPAGRFWVHGQHDSHNIPEDASCPILIDAGPAFGSGHHGTTKGCLVLFDGLLSNGFSPKSVLDLGCGAGILAIAAAKQLNAEILATDIDQDAVDTTLANARINGAENLISSFAADGTSHPNLAGRSFEFVFANILAGPLIDMAESVASVVTPKGTLMLSGMMDDQAARVLAAYESLGFRETRRLSIENWTSLVLVKS